SLPFLGRWMVHFKYMKALFKISIPESECIKAGT
ncbi:hypothetical protein PSYPI_43461, partial [Pseudomonas syringae pv. pisi str. 1704B]